MLVDGLVGGLAESLPPPPPSLPLPLSRGTSDTTIWFCPLCQNPQGSDYLQCMWPGCNGVPPAVRASPVTVPVATPRGSTTASGAVMDSGGRGAAATPPQPHAVLQSTPTVRVPDATVRIPEAPYKAAGVLVYRFNNVLYKPPVEALLGRLRAQHRPPAGGHRDQPKQPLALLGGAKGPEDEESVVATAARRFHEKTGRVLEKGQVRAP